MGNKTGPTPCLWWLTKGSRQKDYGQGSFKSPELAHGTCECWYNLVPWSFWPERWIDAMSDTWNCRSTLVRERSFLHRWPRHIQLWQWERGSNGVAFITSRFISKHVLGYNPVSNRTISIRIQAQPITSQSFKCMHQPPQPLMRILSSFTTSSKTPLMASQRATSSW